MSKKIKEINLLALAISLLILLVGYFLVITVIFYGFGVENSFVKKTLKFLPYPAAFVSSAGYVSIGELESELAAVKGFYENQDFANLGYRVDFSTEDGKTRLMIKKKRILNKLIENRVIEMLAKKRGMEIDNEIVSQEVDKSIEQYGSGEKLLENLEKFYGWNLNDFEEKIVKPEMYKENLSQYVRTGDSDAVVAKNKIEIALSEINSGKDFSEVASEYSEGESAKNGGDLGWLSVDQMIPEIALTVSLLEKEKNSNVLESPLGFHIIKFEDKKTENDVEMFKLSQVFVKAKNFSEWLIEQEKDIKIYIPLKDFYWDTEIQEVRFKDEKIEEFEKNINENSAGDISVIF